MGLITLELSAVTDLGIADGDGVSGVELIAGASGVGVIVGAGSADVCSGETIFAEMSWRIDLMS